MAEQRDGRQWYENLPGEPLDSVEQLNRFDIPLGKAHSCSKPDQQRNSGCPCWDTCELSFKGTRPHNGGVEVIKQTSSGVKTRREITDCFRFNLMRNSLEDNEAVVDWIAEEGDEFIVDETSLQKIPTPEGMTPKYEHLPVTVAKIIPKFKCLEDRKEAKAAVRLEERRAEESIKRAERKRSRVIGIANDPDEGVGGKRDESEVFTLGASSGGEGGQPVASAGKGTGKRGT